MNASFLLEGLLRHNYLPLQKKDKEEVPPFLTTAAFTPTIAKKLLSVRRRNAGMGWDAVTYQATRFNGIGRPLTVPHPLPHALLCYSIHDNWADLAYSAASKHSLVRPRHHPDGRVIIMNYEKPQKLSHSLAFGKRFRVRTDIANFFPSIYSHAITWAAVGFAHAKANQSGNWFNELDKFVRWTKRNETQGIAIGPATSNVVAEAILVRVDDFLEQQGFEFFRYIDDYTAYCATEDQAQDFVLALSQRLADYKLSLGLKKTSIVQLPLPDNDEWIAELTLPLPTREVDKYTAMHFLNKACVIAVDHPGGSVLKYAIKTLRSRKLKPGVVGEILPQVMNLAFHQPTLVPLLGGLLRNTVGIGAFKYGANLHQIAAINARFRRSDGLCWSLFFMNRHKVPIEDQLATDVVATKDCLALMLLYLSGIKKHQDLVVDFAKQYIANAADMYELDQYWILLYEMFREGKISTPYSGERAFEFLKKEGVSFLATAPAAQTLTQPTSPTPLAAQAAVGGANP
ncbi:MAG TPA: antiviral reverse transcriptase Drt4 [Candidatus Koribacter sp.]